MCGRKPFSGTKKGTSSLILPPVPAFETACAVVSGGGFGPWEGAELSVINTVVLMSLVFSNFSNYF